MSNERYVFTSGTSQTPEEAAKYPTMFLYKGKRLKTFTKEELIKIAEEGWQMYHNQLQSSMSATRLMYDLHKESYNETY